MSAAAPCTCSGPTSARSAPSRYAPDRTERGIGHALLDTLIGIGRDLGLSRLFALTFQTQFFGRAGFVPIEGAPVDPDTYAALRRSYDAGVAEFLNLEYASPTRSATPGCCCT